MSARQKSGSKTQQKISVPVGFEKVSDSHGVAEFELSRNGLRVLVVPIPGSPTVTTNIVYRVGSQHEGRGETGLSHMLEHMLFKRTKGTGPKWKDLENRGALMNATTWLDRTMYYFTLPSEHLRDMLTVEADRMRGTHLTDDEFLPERTNVLSEYEMYNSRPDMALDWELVSTAFHYHGYRHDTIGFRRDIESYTTKKLKAYYDTHYWPNRATLVIAGDLPTTTMLREVKRAFGDIPRGPNAPLFHEVEPPQEGIRRVALMRETPIREMHIAYKAPAFSDRSWSALYLALTHLTDGETSPLYRALVEKKLATGVAANLYPTMDPFLAFLTITVGERVPYERIEKMVVREVAELSNHPIPKARLDLLKTELYAHDLFSRDGGHNVATQLAEYVATGNWKRYFDHLEEITSISGKEIQTAVQTYLVPEKATIGIIGV